MVGQARAVLDRLVPNAPDVMIHDLDWNEDERLRDWLAAAEVPDALVRVDKIISDWILISTLEGRKGWVAAVTAGSPTLLQPDADVICAEVISKNMMVRNLPTTLR